MSSLKINGRRIPFTVQRKEIQHIYMKIGSDLRLEIVLPQREKISVSRFLKSNLPWIKQKVEEMSKMKRLFTGNTILFKGEPLKVKGFRVRSEEGGRRNGRRRKGFRLYKNVVFVYENSKKKRDEILKNFITRQTLRHVNRDAKRWVRSSGMWRSEFGKRKEKIHKIEVKEMKNWGYCTKKGDLLFNWRLICLPERLRKYVVLHELLHTKYFNHSNGFKSEMAKHIGDFQKVEGLLRNYLPF